MANNRHILGKTMQQQLNNRQPNHKRPSMVPKVHFLVTAIFRFAFISLRGEDREGFE